jgi:hypothetical protein
MAFMLRPQDATQLAQNRVVWLVKNYGPDGYDPQPSTSKKKETFVCRRLSRELLFDQYK